MFQVGKNSLFKQCKEPVWWDLNVLNIDLRRKYLRRFRLDIPYSSGRVKSDLALIQDVLKTGSRSRFFRRFRSDLTHLLCKAKSWLGHLKNPGSTPGRRSSLGAGFAAEEEEFKRLWEILESDTGKHTHTHTNTTNTHTSTHPFC